jgi:hypothetical protein
MTTLQRERAARDEALSRVALNAEAWMDEARKAIADLARTREPFTTDDVWQALCGLEPPDGRAMGAAMLKAKAAGLIDKTGHWRESKRVGCHCRPVAVWRGC